MVVLTLEKGSNTVLAGPDIVTRGFIYVKESDDIMEEARAVAVSAMEKIQDKNITDWGRMKSIIKDAMSSYVWKKMKRRPMILPVISEVDI
jgi:ribonuclease J